MTATHQTRWPIWLAGAVLLAMCSSPASEVGRDAAAGAGAPDAKAATGGRTGSGGATHLGPDAMVLGGATRLGPDAMALDGATRLGADATVLDGAGVERQLHLPIGDDYIAPS